MTPGIVTNGRRLRAERIHPEIQCYDPLMRELLAALLLTLIASTTLRAQTVEGDRHWNQRAEGHMGTRAQAAPIDAAILAYRKAITTAPDDLEAHWKLLRALRFRAAHAVTGVEEKKKAYDQGRNAGAEALRVVQRLLSSRGVPSIDKTAEDSIANAARGIPGTVEVYYWNAANWGEWALVFGKMAALRQGAADRIRRDATIAMLIDPAAEEGGGARILGRLHNQTPRVLFVTGWASDELAVKFLRQALTAAPSNTLTKVFLAEAMVADRKARKPEAIALLQAVMESAIDAANVIENLDAREKARNLLDEWRR